MALLADRNELIDVDISHFMNETAEPGVLVVYDTSSSGVGAAMDDSGAVVKLPDVVSGSGEGPAGILLDNVVNIDQTRQHLNQHKREVQIGGKVTVLRKGTVVTNMIESGYHPVPGAAAFFTTNGLLNGTSVVTDSNPDVAATQIGRWGGSKNSDGYAKLHVNIQ